MFIYWYLDKYYSKRTGEHSPSTNHEVDCSYYNRDVHYKVSSPTDCKSPRFMGTVRCLECNHPAHAFRQELELVSNHDLIYEEIKDR